MLRLHMPHNDWHDSMPHAMQAYYCNAMQLGVKGCYLLAAVMQTGSGQSLLLHVERLLLNHGHMHVRWGALHASRS